MNRTFASMLVVLIAFTVALVRLPAQSQHATDGQWHSFSPSHGNSGTKGDVRLAASDDPASAVFPIVYQVDDGVPGPRGYRYFFYGNGFFINRGGYLLTAAHVLGQLRGAQPYLLIRSQSAGPHFVQANLIAQDADHDVALLQATPNPFEKGDVVSALALAPELATSGEMVEAASAMPPRPRDAYSLDRLREDHSAGEILRFEFSQLTKAPADTELFLFNHAIQSGQSGAPVIVEASGAAAGIVEGQWLREDSPITAMPASTAAAGGNAASEKASGAGEKAATEIVAEPGAVVPIHYAIALLNRQGVTWDDALVNERPEGSGSSSLPQPLSLVPARYPRESLFGGEVLLDALVERNGTVSDVKVMHGDQPFLAKSLDAVHTWTFVPAEGDGHASQTRVAIAFEFPQPYDPPREATRHEYRSESARGEQGAEATGIAARALETVEPGYPSPDTAEGTVILYETIDADGRVASVRTVREGGALTASAIASANAWHFAPAKSSGAPIESAAIISVTFRHALATSDANQPQTQPQSSPPQK